MHPLLNLMFAEFGALRHPLADICVLSLILSFLLCPVFACCPFCLWPVYNFTKILLYTASWGSITCTGQGLFALWTPGECASTRHCFPRSGTVSLPLVLPCQFGVCRRPQETAHWEPWLRESTEGCPSFGKLRQVDWCSHCS